MIKSLKSMKTSSVQQQNITKRAEKKQPAATGLKQTNLNHIITPSFTGTSAKQKIWIHTAQDALKLIGDKKKLDPNNQYHVETIMRLNAVLGGDEIETLNPKDFDEKIKVKNGLNIENLNKDNNLSILKRTLVTMLKATEYNPIEKQMDGYKLQVNNKELAPLIKNEYSHSDFKKLVNTLDEHNTFAIKVHPELGIVKTAGTTAEENFEMGARYWITDSCHNIRLMKDKTPNDVKIAIGTIARFYNENNDKIQSFIDDSKPAIDAVRGSQPENAKLLGIPHIFIPHQEDGQSQIVLEPDKDFNRWRQESHGNALKTIVTGIKEGLIEDKKYGLGKKDINKDVVDTVANLTKYFCSIDVANIPSSGNWEEKPFERGLTYDTAVITGALKETKDLMFNPKYDKNKDIKAVRERIKASANGNIFNNSVQIDKAIQATSKRIKETYSEEAPSWSDSPATDTRKFDASQAFTVRIADLDPDPYKGAFKAIEVLEGLEKNLEGEFGISRYNDTKVNLPDGSSKASGDSYLGPNYEIAADKKGGINLGFFEVKSVFGATDASSAEAFLARNAICGGEKDEIAQWFFQPVVSSAYNKVRKDLVEHLKKHPEKSDQIKPLIKKCFEKQTEHLNKAFAVITGEDSYKANGVKCRSWGIPEAYMKVSTFEPQKTNSLFDKSKKSKFVPGLNTPLAWAQTELWTACKDYKEAIG